MLRDGLEAHRGVGGDHPARRDGRDADAREGGVAAEHEAVDGGRRGREGTTAPCPGPGSGPSADGGPVAAPRNVEEPAVREGRPDAADHRALADVRQHALYRAPEEGAALLLWG